MQPACNLVNKPLPHCWPRDWALVGFTDFTGGNAGTDLLGMRLARCSGPAALGCSPWYKAGTDGLDVGTNVPAVLAAVSGVQ